jgi:hypothetical protein
MTGDERARYRERCASTVHDLSAMARAEAETPLNSGQPTCAILRYDSQRRVITRDSPRAWLRRQLRAATPLAGAASILLQPGPCSSKLKAPPPVVEQPSEPDLEIATEDLLDDRTIQLLRVTVYIE